MTRLVTPLVRQSQTRLTAESGSVLIEALVGAVLVAVMAVAFFGALTGSERVSGTAKLRATAASLAQDDQERLRSMPVAALNNLRESNPRSVAGVNFTVDSRADWIADQSKATTCTSNGAAADYLKITTTVTPTNASPLKPVAITSTVTPAPGSFNGKGSLAVRAVDRNGDPVSGVAVNVTGPATGTAFTDATGCAFLGYLPAGTTYAVTASKSQYVDEDGDPTPTKSSVTINDQQVATLEFKVDLAGAAKATFVSKPIDNTSASRGDVDSAQWQLVMSNGSHTPARTFGSAYPTTVPNGSPWKSTGDQASIDAPQLFPFTSAYSVYAGAADCVKNSPAQNGVSDPGLLVAPGNTSLTFKQQLPALNLYATVNGARPTDSLRVKITSITSGCASWSIVRLTSASGSAQSLMGVLPDPGLPYGTYDVCVDNAPMVGAASARRASKLGVANTALPGTALQTGVGFNINTSTGTPGKCP
jgi:Tfp pilus assembly protein PilV